MEIEKEFVGNSMDTGRAEKISAAMDAAKAEVGGDKGSAPSKDESPRAQAIREAAQAIDEANAAEEAGDESGEATAPTAKPRAKRAAAPAEETPPEETIGISEVVQERRRLRREHDERGRKLNQSFAAREQQLQSTVQQVMPLVHAAECLQAGDMDGLARALAHFKGDASIADWKSLSREIERVAHVPGYSELRALRADQSRRDQMAHQQQQAHGQAQQQQARAAQEQQWVASIADDLTSDEDPAVADIVNVDPQFAHHVFGTQRRHHSESGEIMPPREAAKRVLGQLYKNVAGWQAFFQKHAGSAWLKEVMRAGGSTGSAAKPASRTAPTRQAAPKQPPAKPSAAAASQKKRDELVKHFATEMNRTGKDPSYGW
jgi:hypothetical protein